MLDAMKPSGDYIDYLLELLEPLGDVRARRMFGGFGIYRDDLMFALVAGDTLYLKADDGNRPAFEALDLPSFVYHKNGRPYSMSYYQAPADALEDGPLLCRWAREAHQAALRATAGRSARRRRPDDRRSGSGT